MGFGFISPRNGDAVVFVHHSTNSGSDQKSLTEVKRVTFVIQPEPKVLAAWTFSRPGPANRAGTAQCDFALATLPASGAL